MRNGRWLRSLTVATILVLPLAGISGVASAKGHHHKGTVSGKGGPSAPMTIQVDPSPVLEVAGSNINVVVQVETSPAYAGDQVSISSSQLFSSCDGPVFVQTEQASGPFSYWGATYSTDAPLTVALDDDGNVTVEIDGIQCAAGSDLIEADLAVVPYYTAVATLTVSPPAVTTPGVFGDPTSSGTVTGGEVETGDAAAPPPSECGECYPPPNGQSDVYAVFYVETDPVYAEQPVELSDNQLEDSCGGGAYWFDSYGDYLGSTPETVLDDDGNAVFVFWGASCAATTSEVVADVDAGTHPTYTTTFRVLPPQPTI